MITRKETPFTESNLSILPGYIEIRYPSKNIGVNITRDKEIGVTIEEYDATIERALKEIKLISDMTGKRVFLADVSKDKSVDEDVLMELGFLETNRGYYFRMPDDFHEPTGYNSREERNLGEALFSSSNAFTLAQGYGVAYFSTTLGRDAREPVSQIKVNDALDRQEATSRLESIVYLSEKWETVPTFDKLTDEQQKAIMNSHEDAVIKDIVSSYSPKSPQPGM